MISEMEISALEDRAVTRYDLFWLSCRWVYSVKKVRQVKSFQFRERSMKFDMPKAVFCGLALIAAAIFFGPGSAQATAQAVKKNVCPLIGPGKAADKNKNGIIERDEAGGPVKAAFDFIDCDKSGTLTGCEIKGFFTGKDCPK
tara:strand:- start:287 stop:715 length:429 start_codon:yes stop_codon:yes gene_type:complete